ncbi:MAG: addiction module protein [Verrucomicrobia bacterium]|nr:addiction module protein [Verrucomicrobiota bacterium]MCH8514564.1 addiction module protein [Kiritimatiellia bacterium]
MSITDLRQLPSLEKLKIIEILWSDVVRDDDSFPSPSWHLDELRETEEAYKTGKISAIDWEDAKKQIRAKVE